VEEAAVPTPPAEETDIDRAREEAGGALGDVTVTLLWNGLTDLDLVIGCPSGGSLSGSRNNQCGGRVDIDANLCSNRAGGAGSVCNGYSGEAVRNPIENGYFETDAAQAGTYTIRVQHYAAARDTADQSIPWVVQLRQGEARQRFEGTSAPGTTVDVATFSVR
jgi:hypothetical protein